jgi:integrase
MSLLGTGLRVSEILQLTRQDLHRRSINPPEGAKPRTLEIPPTSTQGDSRLPLELVPTITRLLDRAQHSNQSASSST